MTARTSEDYRPCVMLFPSGRQQRGNVAYVRLDSVQAAREKLAMQQVAWVKPEDVEAVISGETT